MLHFGNAVVYHLHAAGIIRDVGQQVLAGIFGDGGDVVGVADAVAQLQDVAQLVEPVLLAHEVEVVHREQLQHAGPT